MANKLISYIRESRDELRKVIWPSRQETIRHTLLVVGVSVTVAIVLGIADYVFTIGFEKLLLKVT